MGLWTTGDAALRGSINFLINGTNSVSKIMTPEGNKIQKLKAKNNGIVVWLDGLPAAGKSTIANSLCRFLYSHGVSSCHLDSDLMRQNKRNFGFDANGRRLALLHYVSLANENLTKDVVVCSSVTYSNELQALARSSFPNFIEVYVKCSLKECIRRDCEGVRAENNFYRRALDGTLPGYVGIELPFEEPKSPELVIDTEHCDVLDATKQIYTAIRRKISPSPL